MRDVETLLARMRSRYTTKHYDPARRIPDDYLEALLEVLRLAPSSVNIQPWHFYVVRSPEAKARLMPSVKDFNAERVRDADCVIVFAIEKDLTNPAYLDRLLETEKADGRFAPGAAFEDVDALRRHAVFDYCRTEESGERWASEQVHIALGFATSAAAELGIDSTVLGGLFFERFDEDFGLRAEKRRSVVALALGYRAPDDSNATRPKSRFPKQAVVTML